MRKSIGSLTAAGTLLFATAAMAATVTYVTVLPTLAFGAPGYVPNGSITATVADVPGCTAGIYTVNATPIAGSGPAASSPPSTTVTTYIGFPQGAFFVFNNAGWGSYTITTTTTACGVGAPPPPTIDVVTIAPPATIPTMAEWAMILLALLMAGSGAVLVRRRFA